MTFQSKDDFRLVPGPSGKEIAKSLNEPVHKHFGWLTVIAFAVPAFVLIVGSAFAQEQENNRLVPPANPSFEILGSQTSDDQTAEQPKTPAELRKDILAKKVQIARDKEKLEKMKQERQKKLKEGLGEAMKKVQEMTKQIHKEIRPENVAQMQAKWEQLSKQMNELLAKYKSLPVVATTTPSQ